MSKEINAQVGRAIRKRRRDLDMTQEQLGQAIHLGRTSIANIESGRQHLSVHLLLYIAAALDVAPASLLPEVPAASAEPQEQLNRKERREVMDAVKAARGGDR